MFSAATSSKRHNLVANLPAESTQLSTRAGVLGARALTSTQTDSGSVTFTAELTLSASAVADMRAVGQAQEPRDSINNGASTHTNSQNRSPETIAEEANQLSQAADEKRRDMLDAIGELRLDEDEIARQIQENERLAKDHTCLAEKGHREKAEVRADIVEKNKELAGLEVDAASKSEAKAKADAYLVEQRAATAAGEATVRRTNNLKDLLSITANSCYRSVRELAATKANEVGKHRENIAALGTVRIKLMLQKVAHQQGGSNGKIAAAIAELEPLHKKARAVQSTATSLPALGDLLSDDTKAIRDLAMDRLEDPVAIAAASVTEVCDLERILLARADTAQGILASVLGRLKVVKALHGSGLSHLASKVLVECGVATLRELQLMASDPGEAMAVANPAEDVGAYRAFCKLKDRAVIDQALGVAAGTAGSA